MKNNFYNIPEDWYQEFNNNFNISNNKDINSNLANPKEAFLRGNLFNNLYDTYKNYKYANIESTNKREELLYNILMYMFVLNELDLYLDNYPNDRKIINLYNYYLKEKLNLVNEYEKTYEVLTLDSKYLEDNNWKWIKSPWPWEGDI